MDQIAERSTGYLTVTPLNKSGDPEAPASLSYRIDDVQSGTSIRGDTAIAAASSVEIALTPDDNQILDPTHANERRLVTVTATYGVSDAVRSEYEYRVINLRFV